MQVAYKGLCIAYPHITADPLDSPVCSPIGHSTYPKTQVNLHAPRMGAHESVTEIIASGILDCSCLEIDRVKVLQKPKAKLILEKAICFEMAIEEFDTNPEHACGPVLMPTHHIQGP